VSTVRTVSHDAPRRPLPPPPSNRRMR
jgi:hypothetical protein